MSSHPAVRCWVEALGVGAYDFGGNPPPTPAALVAMAAVSPIRHLVPAAAGTAPALRAPVLLLLGLKDKRVPASQGIEFLHSARAAGVTARCVRKGRSGAALTAIVAQR